MKEVRGLYASALVFTDEAEDYALAQIKQLCDQPAFQGSRIRVMPDVHPGKVGPIGYGGDGNSACCSRDRYRMRDDDCETEKDKAGIPEG